MQGRRWSWLTGLGLLLVLSQLVAACSVPGLPGGSATTPPANTTTVQRGTVEATINATGSVRAQADLSLNPATSGTITAVLVRIGERVTAGQPLLQLDTRELRLALQQAEANLASAQAKYEQAAAGATEKEVAQAAAAVDSAQAKLQQTITGTTTAQDITNAQAALRSAEAKLAATRAGTTTDADLANAEAALRSAQSKLAQAQAGPDPNDLTTAQQKIQQAQENRAKLASQLANSKEQARLAIEQAANSLRDAQQRFGAAKLIYDEAVRTGKDPTIPVQKNPTNKSYRDLTDAKLRQFKSEFESTQLALANAEQTLQQKQLTYEDAKQQEISGLQTAESQLIEAQANLAKLTAPPDEQTVAQAQATVDQAQANLDKLRQPVKETDITQAQAAVDQARANLAKLQRGADPNDVTQARANLTSVQAALADLQAGAKATDLATTLAAVKQTEAARDAQKLKLDGATVSAPFSGVVAAVSAIPGQTTSSSGTSGLITLVDDSVLTIDVNVAESDITKIALDQPARVSFAGLPNQTINGMVVAIAPKSTIQSNVVTYLVSVALERAATTVKTGMTATVAIITGHKSEVLSVPNRAIQTQGQQKLITVSTQGTTTSVPVQVGLVGDTRTEVTAGLKEGDTIVIGTTSPTSSTTTTNRQPSTGLGIPGTGPMPKP